MFQPSAYTAALMLALRQRADRVRGATALELGTGSGVVLATLLGLDASRVVGVELEPLAMACTRDLLARTPGRERAELLPGDLWAPCAGRRFDLVATNLPQFPLPQALASTGAPGRPATLATPGADGRLPSWSDGGPDGRRLVDRFLLGLPEHLAPGGLALMTHNVFVDLALTRQRLQALGLQAEVAATVSLPLAPAKFAALPAPVRQAWLGRGLHCLGEFVFADFHVLAIAAMD